MNSFFEWMDRPFDEELVYDGVPHFVINRFLAVS